MKSRNSKNNKKITLYGILIALIICGILTSKIYKKFK